MTTPVWIDTDPAVGVPGRDVDDGLALLQALGSPELEVVGISTVFGNTDLERAHAIAGELLDLAGRDDVPLYRGAAGPGELGKPTAASCALAAALARTPMDVLALGPLTNVATALRDPEAAALVRRVVAVAGRRPGQRFQVGTGQPLADMNFECDVAAVAELLAHEDLDLLLAGFEVASRARIGEQEIARLEAGPPAARWLAEPARRRLELWRARFGVEGFHPFDTLAVACVATPHLIEVDDVDVTIVGTGATAELHATPHLAGARPARYAHRAAESVVSDVMARILATRARSRTVGE